MTPEERIAVLEARHDELDKRLEHMDGQLEKLVAWANRWKGGVAVLLGVGALVGWFADKLFELLPGNNS